MFGLFKKTRWKIEGKAFNFFRQVFIQLPIEFQFLSNQLDKGVYRRFAVNHAMQEHFYSIGFDSSESDKAMIKGKQFELKNIIIKEDGQEYSLNLTIYDGLWIGFEVKKNILTFNNFLIDVSSIRKSKSKFYADTKIEKLVAGLTSEYLNLTDLPELDIEGKTYYEIKDLQDGNYIVIDNIGHVFALLHDPYQLERISNSIRQFVDDINSGHFSCDAYLNRKQGNV